MHFEDSPNLKIDILLQYWYECETEDVNSIIKLILENVPLLNWKFLIIK
jgi:hypothetical protein